MDFANLFYAGLLSACNICFPFLSTVLTALILVVLKKTHNIQITTGNLLLFVLVSYILTFTITCILVWYLGKDIYVM
jgi:hypothetical protein